MVLGLTVVDILAAIVIYTIHDRGSQPSLI